MPKTYGTAGPRWISPTVCTSVPLAACSLEAQLLFDRLISQADDQGRLQGEPRIVAALCMPLVKSASERTVARWLAELAGAKLVMLYAVAGRQYVQLAGWWDNQGTPRRAYQSRHPAPDGWVDRVKVDGSLPPDRGETPQNAPDRGETPLAGAPAHPPLGSALLSPAQPDSHAPDAAVSYNQRTGRYPSSGILKWLSDIARKAGAGDELAGEARVAALIDRTPYTGTPKEYLELIDDTIRREDHDATARELREEADRLAAKRAKPPPIRAMPVEQTEEEANAELAAYYAAEGIAP